MKVLAFDEFPNAGGKAIGEYVSLDDLFARPDVISLHCPLFPSTQGLINKGNITKMQDCVIIINTSRGPLVVEEDLTDAWMWFPPSLSVRTILCFKQRTV